MVESVSEKILNIAKNRGFFFPSAEIYGAKAGFWTYGHLGTLMKNKWQCLWKKFFLNLSNNYYEIEDCNMLPKGTFVSSGHLEHFNDPLTECSKCHFRFRADELIEDETKVNVDGLDAEAMDKIVKDNSLKCPKCGSALDKVKWFNMMFELKVGAVGDDIMYLRPETAQSPYLSFKREFSALREKLPMGLAVIGRAFRNEISPRQAFFRLREFTQAELQIFFNPKNVNEADNWGEVEKEKIKILFVKNKKEAIEVSCKELNTEFKIPKFYVYHLAKIQEFYLNVLKIPKEKFRFRELSEKERAFYNKIHFDIEISMESLGGFKEVGGLHYRTDHDLKGHQEGSKEKLEVNIDGEKFIPHVLELSFGVDRNLWALMETFFEEEKERNLFKFPFSVAPISLAVFPLVNKDGLPEKAEKIYLDLEKNFEAFYDSKGSIGRMYRRMDEIGCAAMITIDHQTLTDGTVTLRDRDTMKQIRVSTKKLGDTLSCFFEGKKLEKLGKILS